jgi:hypothetical protein
VSRASKRRAGHQRPAPSDRKQDTPDVAEEMIRPGPVAITPGAHPGGVVLHIYAATVPPSLIMTRRYRSTDNLAACAPLDYQACEAMGYGALCLVAYDGDTGQRFTADDWTRP